MGNVNPPDPFYTSSGWEVLFALINNRTKVLTGIPTLIWSLMILMFLSACRPIIHGFYLHFIDFIIYMMKQCTVGSCLMEFWIPLEGF